MANITYSNFNRKLETSITINCSNAFRELLEQESQKQNMTIDEWLFEAACEKLVRKGEQLDGENALYQVVSENAEDEGIDLSDIPETTPEFWANARRYNVDKIRFTQKDEE